MKNKILVASILFIVTIALCGGIIAFSVISSKDGGGTGGGMNSGDVGGGDIQDVLPGDHIHQWTDWVVTQDPTTKATGKLERQCKDETCKKVDTFVLPILNDKDYVVTTLEPATCTKAGKAHYKYNNNAYPYEVDVDVPQAEHDFGEWVVDVEPTCTTKGSRHRECATCKKVVTEEIPLAAHKYELKQGDADNHWYECTVCHEKKDVHAHDYEWTENVEATCAHAGHRKGVCKVCGKKIDEHTDVLPHDWGTEWVSDDTHRWKECSMCHEKKDIEAHDFVVTIEKQPTCHAPGLQVKVCKKCGHRIETEIPQLEHQWGAWVVTDEATCGKAGHQYRICDVCKDKEEAEIPMLPEHSYEYVWEPGSNVHYKKCTVCGKVTTPVEHVLKWTILRPATCTEEGKMVGECECGYKVYAPINIVEHDLGDWVVGKKPTCTEPGMRFKECKHCHRHIVEDEIAPTGIHAWMDRHDETHHWSECQECGIHSNEEEHTFIWNVVEDSTCDKAGYKHGICPVCGYEKDEIIPRKPHTIKQMTDDNYHWNYCTVCNQIVGEKTPHDFDINIIKSATCNAEGEIEKVCKHCGKTIRETIPKVAHTYGEWIIDQDPTCTAAGSKHRVCSVCGEAEAPVQIMPLGHNYELTPCDGDDLHHCYKCTRCGEIKPESKFEHDSHYFSNATQHWQMCIKCGKKTTPVNHALVYRSTPTEHWQICEECGYESVHTAHDMKVTVVEPTCTEGGYTLHECICGYSYKSDIKPPLGHNHVYRYNEANPTQHWKECLNCHEKINFENHTLEIVEEVPATCKKAGYKIERCKQCGYEKRTEFPIIQHTYVPKHNSEYGWQECSMCGAKKEGSTHVHNFTQINMTKEQTCEIPGMMDAYCDICGEWIRNIELPALGHVYPNNEEYTPDPDHPATCTQEGIEYRICDICGHREERPIPKIEHQYNTTIDASGAQVPEYKFDDNKHWYTCKVCGDVTESIELHQYEKRILKAPTCTTEGQIELKCKCGKTIIKTISMLEPEWGEWEITLAPTCTTPGERTRKCIHKGCANPAHVETETIPVVEHEYVMTIDGTDETSTQHAMRCKWCGQLMPGTQPEAHNYVYDNDGTTHWRVCTICGHIENGEIAGKLPHSYVDKVIPPSCGKPGYTKHKCECGYHYEDTETPALQHNFSPDWSADDAQHWHECANCGDKRDISAHTYEPKFDGTHHWLECSICHHKKDVVAHNEIITIVAPTCTEQGYTLHTCDGCGYSNKTDFVDATGHKYVDKADDAHAWKECTECGNIIDKVAHQYDPQIKHDETHHWVECMVCHHKKNVEPHKYGEPMIVAPTCTEAGYTVRKCACGHEDRYDYVNATGHNWVNARSDDGHYYRVCETCQETKEHSFVTVTENGETWQHCTECGFDTPKTPALEPGQGKSVGEQAEPHEVAEEKFAPESSKEKQSV